MTVYTLENGRMSMMMPAGTSREARRRRAVTMPMSFFECEADIRPGREIVSVRDVRLSDVFAELYQHPVKIAVAMFMADFLGVILREGQNDQFLFSYLKRSAEALHHSDDMESANFLIVFLYKLTHFLGIEPDTETYAPGSVFDMPEGLFRLSPPLHSRYLVPAEASVLWLISRMTWRNMGRFRFNREQRRRIISLAMDYYAIHFASLSAASSREIFRQLFD